MGLHLACTLIPMPTCSLCGFGCCHPYILHFQTMLLMLYIHVHVYMRRQLSVYTVTVCTMYSKAWE